MVQILAGNDVLAGDIPIKTITVKSVAQSVTNSTTLVNDNDMVTTLGIGLWVVELRASVTGANAAGITIAWTSTGTMTSSQRQCFGPVMGATPMSGGTAGADKMRATAHSLGTSISYGGLGTSTAVIVENLLMDVSIAGTLQMQWAQNTANATATSVTSGARLIVQPAQYA